MCESSVEKLKILDYEVGYCKKYNRRPFSQVHFAIPGPNPSVQFDEFTNICAWLCTEITAKVDTFKIEQFDDPNTIINKLMLALRQLDFRSSFPPQKLKIPHGEPICAVLDFLTDKALEKRGFQWALPVHNEADLIEQAPAEPEDDDIIDDDVPMADGEDEVFFEDQSRLEASLDSSAHNLITAQIDPIEWKTELERVGPKLKASSVMTANEWRSHVDQTVNTSGQIERLMGDSTADISAMNKLIGDELSQLKNKEKYINNQYHTLGLEFVKVNYSHTLLSFKNILHKYLLRCH